MQFTTPVALPPTAFTLRPTDGAVLLGSCFADAVGEHLCAALDDCAHNPFGTLYNPLSIARCLEILSDADGEAAAQAHIFLGRDGLWRSWLHSSHFSAPTEAACREAVSGAFRRAQATFQSARLLVITFGTDRYYSLADSGLVVSNCQKEPPATFCESTASVDEAFERLAAVLRPWTAADADRRVVLTVSPYRYVKYGLHASQLSKARLLLLADRLEQSLERVSYFPAYEILLDELRDYRFFAADMVHPSPVAADYIFSRFADWCFTPQLLQRHNERRKALRAAQHIHIAQGGGRG